jgi:hypothetical protein
MDDFEGGAFTGVSPGYVLVLPGWAENGLHDRATQHRESLQGAKMRQVKYKTSVRDKTGLWELIDGGTALFHAWGVQYEEFESGPGNFSVAILELDDGSVITVPAGFVTFLEPPK